MKGFSQKNIEEWMTEFVEQMPLTPANAERLNIMAEAMKNMKHISRKFTEEDAKEWAKKMNPPAKWTMDQTTAVMNQRGFHHKPWEFFVAMNALYSDYGKTAAKYNVDKPEFWAEMANDFISDLDAEEDKVGRYWRDVVKH